MRDAKGLHCLAYLLRRPGQKFAATELLTIPAAAETSGVDAEAVAVHAESARVLVTKRIRSVVKKIEAHHPSLAHHLGTCIKTGAYCVYLPDPAHPLRWAT